MNNRQDSGKWPRARKIDFWVGGSTTFLYGAMLIRASSTTDVLPDKSPSNPSSIGVLLMWAMCAAGVHCCIGTPKTFKFHGVVGSVAAGLLMLAIALLAADGKLDAGSMALGSGVALFTLGGSLYSFRRRKQAEWALSVATAVQPTPTAEREESAETEPATLASSDPAIEAEPAARSAFPEPDDVVIGPARADKRAAGERLANLERLSELRERGALTDAEFELLKRDELSK